MRRSVAGLAIIVSSIALGQVPSAPGAADDLGPTPAPRRLSEGEAEALSRLHAAHRQAASAGALATERGQTREVRQYGQALIDSHTHADRRLRQLAQGKRVTLTEVERDALRQLRKAHPADFDEAFVATMIAQHDAAIELVREAQEDAGDRDMLAFLRSALAQLKQLRDAAERIHDRSRR
jgi:putative membrane protein